MHVRKIIAKGLIIGITVSSTPINSNAISFNIFNKDNEDITMEKINKKEVKINKKNQVNKIKEKSTYESKVTAGKVLSVTLKEGEKIPTNLAGNPDGYETIKVITTGDKVLEDIDFTRLRGSGIPNIDLSGASAYRNKIPNGAFYKSTSLKSFKFPNSVTTIGKEAFRGCSGLTGDLVIPDSVTTIEDVAFSGCSGLTGDLVIPNSVTTIGDSAFMDCSGLNGNLAMSDSVTAIGDRAFSGCSGLTGNLVIPNSVTTIGVSAFSRCSGLTGDLVIPDSVTTIGIGAFSGCSGLTGELVIPNSVTTIEENTFRGCSGLTGNLVIPDSVTYVGVSAFSGCSGLTGDLVIPDSVTSIGMGAFSDCSGLTGELVIPNSVTAIYNRVFFGCSGLIGNLVIPDSVTYIGADAFSGCSGLTGDLVIPDSVTLIGPDAFQGCSKIENIIIKIDASNESTNYKKGIVDNLPDTNQTIIEMPYDFNLTGTWMESMNKKIGKPIVKDTAGDAEHDLIDNKGEKVSLFVPTPYKESNIIVTKNGNPYTLPIKNSEGKYIFIEKGVYNVNITTDLGTVSNISFKVEPPIWKDAEDAVNNADLSKDFNDIENARDLVNNLPESSKKDELQDKLDSIFPNIKLEKKTTTANLDVYIKSENMLSMSLDTNSVTFEDFSGVDDMEKQNAVTLTVNSSLPYELNAYLPTEIQNSDKSKTMNKQILNIKENSEIDYKTFNNTVDKVILKDNNSAGNNITHGIDFKLKGGIAHEKDGYKATIKFEVNQK